MGSVFSLVATLIAAGFVFFILYVLKTNLVRGGFAALWLAIGLLFLSIPLAEEWYVALAHFLGLMRAADLIFIMIIGVGLVFIFTLTVKMQKTNNTLQQLVSHVAILEATLPRDVHALVQTQAGRSADARDHSSSPPL